MAEHKLNIDERFKIIRMQQAAYRRASKPEKGRIGVGDPVGAQDNRAPPQR